MIWLKAVADGLTGMRLVLSVALAGLGRLVGPDGLSTAALFVLAAWTTDALDGPLARRSGVTYQTWIGRNDLLIDLTVAVALLLFMRSAGLIHPVVTAAYLLFWGIILWRCGQLTKPLGAAFQAPVYVAFALSLLVRRLLVGRLMVAWALTNLAVKWKALTQEELPRFVRGIRQARAHLLQGRADDAGT